MGVGYGAHLAYLPRLLFQLVKEHVTGNAHGLAGAESGALADHLHMVESLLRITVGNPLNKLLDHTVNYAFFEWHSNCSCEVFSSHRTSSGQMDMETIILVVFSIVNRPKAAERGRRKEQKIDHSLILRILVR